MVWNLKKKIVTISILSALIPLLLILIIILVQKATVTDDIVQEVDRLAKDNLRQTAIGVYNECSVANELFVQLLERNINTAKESISARGGVSLSGEKIVWNAENQDNKVQQVIQLPKFLIGSQWLGQNYSKDIPTYFIDEMGKSDGLAFTVFQRINEAGDMIRVATNIITKEDKRAIGTFISAKTADNKPNKIITEIMKGKAYRGSAYVVNKFYQTEYIPLKDKSGRIVGMLFVGIAPQNMKNLRSSIQALEVGKTGYVFVLSGTGTFKGSYIISLNGKRDGEHIWDSKDADGKYFVQDIVNNAVKSDEAEVTYIQYPWLNPGDEKPRTKTTAVIYYKPFDWVIGVGAYDDEFRESEQIVKAGMNDLFLYSILAGIIILIIMIAISYFYANKISLPIIKAANLLTTMSQGHLKEAVNDINQYFTKAK